MLVLRKLIDKIGFNWFFLICILFVYFLISIFNYHLALKIGKDFLLTVWKILPVLFFVYFLIFIFNLLIDNKKIKTFLTKGTYWRKTIFAVIGGIASSGPVYLWYPFLKQLLDKGLTYGQIAGFIYARAIKIPLLAFMIAYFGLCYTIVFNLVLFVFSFLIVLVVDMFFDPGVEKKKIIDRN